MPTIGRVLARRSLCRVEQAEWPRSELHQLGHAPGLDVLVRREQIFHGLSADAPFQRAVDVRVEFLGGETRTFVEREMQPEQAPRGILEAVEFFEESSRQLFTPDQALESLMHVERRSHELSGADCLAAEQFDTG